MRNWCYTQRSGLSRPLARSGGSLPFDYGPFGKSRKGKISGLQGATFELKSFRQECGPGMRPGLTGIDDACRDVVAI